MAAPGAIQNSSTPLTDPNLTQHTPAGSDSEESSPGGPPHKSAKRSADHKNEREKRTYRACLHCRQRKSRCDLYSSGEPGRPPCERCIREQHECVLGGSRRGGRRVRRSDLSDPLIQRAPMERQLIPGLDHERRPLSVPLPNERPPPEMHPESRMATWSGFDRESRMLPPLSEIRRTSIPARGSRMTVDDSVMSTDLQNPADALEFLAHVAERDSGQRQQLPSIQATMFARSPLQPSLSRQPTQEIPRSVDVPQSSTIDYAPLNRGYLSLDIVHMLLRRYDEKYHPFFPIANPQAMDLRHLPEVSRREPHLLAAILTAASKDEKDWWQIHETCSTHMQGLIAELVYTGNGTVEAVEAMLILAEWVPRRPQHVNNADSVGRGEEDQVAWMYVGTAIRLGYLLGIDRAGFRSEGEAQSADLNRRRLAWAAVYMSDRQISIRLGKAFWSRGPGPLTGLRADDFPSLRPRHGHQDDFAAIFQAHLELTQLFSNAHDVLYATKNRSAQLNFGGEYVKYIDDFRIALRSWHSTWGVFSASPALKASLILSYEYLRLYVNAFAYQATLNRLVAQYRDAQMNGQAATATTSTFADVAATPDARFIYDSIDAAKSLLSTVSYHHDLSAEIRCMLTSFQFNSFVDPVETFRFMPLRYYLYVIYSACFLYKARATGVMGGDSRGSIKRLILDTIDKLQKSSACPHDIGDRYSRLVRLLWRKPPGRGSIAEGMEGLPGSMRQDAAQAVQNQNQAQAQGSNHRQPSASEDPNSIPLDPGLMYDPNIGPSLGTFSWLDLPAVGDFATTNNSTGGSMDGFDRLDESSMEGFGFDQGMLNMIPQQVQWNTMSPSGIIF